MPIVLASTSPYRRELLERLGLPFRQLAPDVDERPLAGESPAELAARLAEAKARALVECCPTDLIIGSDQTVECGGALLGKPGSLAAAREQLRRQSGRSARFHTAVTVLDAASGVAETRATITEVAFRTLSPAQIDRYLERDAPYDCAGSFKSEGLGIALFRSVRSDDPTALIGLPLILLCALLESFGVDVITS